MDSYEMRPKESKVVFIYGGVERVLRGIIIEDRVKISEDKPIIPKEIINDKQI